MFWTARRTAARIALGAAVVLAGSMAVAQEGETVTAQITDVRSAGEFGTTVLVDKGEAHGLAVGQTAEVQRDGETIGFGSVDAAFADVSVITVGTITAEGGLRSGDTVVLGDVVFRFRIEGIDNHVSGLTKGVADGETGDQPG